MEQLARAVGTDLTLIVHDAHDEELGVATRSISWTVCFFVDCAIPAGDTNVASHRRHGRQKSFGDRVGVIETRLVTGDAQIHSGVCREKILPGYLLRPPLQLVESARMEPAESNNDAARGTKMEVGEIEQAQVAAERNAARLLAPAHSKSFGLTGRNRFQAGRGDDEYLHQGILCACIRQSVKTSNQRVSPTAAQGTLWPRRFPAWTVGTAECGAIRQRCTGSHADRQRQVDDLPAACAPSSRTHHRREPAD